MKQKIDLGEKTMNNKNYFGKQQLQILSLAYTLVAQLTDCEYFEVLPFV